MSPTSLSDLPLALLTYILDLVPPGLAPMLVCKSWWQAALEAPGWWRHTAMGAFLTMPVCDETGPKSWGTFVYEAPVSDASEDEWQAALRGFSRRAAHCRQLDADFSMELSHRAPGLLAAAAAAGAAQLMSLALRVVPGSQQTTCATMEAAAALGSLTHMRLALDGLPASSSLTSSLLPVASATRLESLELELSSWEPSNGGLDSALLGCLARLTALAVLRVGNASPPLQVDWMPADGTGGGPALLSLKLLHCCIAAPSATAAGLEHLQSLRLVGVEGCGGLMEEMWHLRQLTTLSIETPTGADGIRWDAQMDGAMRLMAGALSLQSLLDLRLGRFQSVFSIADFEFEETAECLTAVTSLSLCYAAGPNLLPSAYCAAMTALRRLDVSGYANFNGSVPVLPGEFSRLQRLQHLNLGMCSFGGLPPAVAAVTGLTHLGIALPNISSAEADQALAAATFLPRLQDLVLFAPGRPYLQQHQAVGQHEPQHLPRSLALATALHSLDAAAARCCLELQPGDAALLRELPALGTLVLPSPEIPDGEERPVPDWHVAAWRDAQRVLLDGVAATLGAAGIQVRDTGDGYPADRRGNALRNGQFLEIVPDNAHQAATLAYFDARHGGGS